MEWIRSITIGIAIGGGMILPGVSGGVLAVVFGIYEKMIKAILNFFKDWKKNALFLGPLLIGVALGAIIFGKLLLILFDKSPVEVRFTFIGLILGGLPILFNKIKNHSNGQVNLVVLTISLLLSSALFVLGKNTFDINFSKNLDNIYIAQILLFITGVVFIAGKIIPGISGSFLLMLIGMYEFTLNIIANPFSLTYDELLALIPLGLGVVIGTFVLLKLINYLLENHHNNTYSAIIGFIIGSIAAIYPGFTFSFRGLISIILLIDGFVISYMFSLKNKEEKVYNI